ncbi:MAG: family 2 glycosyl transferase [Bacteroidetes bacterium HGW-Bacteroidetes-12]|nr:MAG: family 2 glycosyl transferase [Bacteroidetes bacterium HGW-Bacteroidetes-12]
MVVIPCYNELNLIDSLKSLFNCASTKENIEVITVINSSDNEDVKIINRNKNALDSALDWVGNHQRKNIHFSFIEATNLPKKEAGVGFARKIGMDESYNQFLEIGRKDGVIVCFDADATCSKNYLVEIENHFKKHTKTTGCSIYFEHPIEGNEYPQAIYEGIIQYELHLRYYKEALAFVGLPYAFHTVGSSMAVRASVYQKQGGMNKRKAGEDFYFLQKVIPLGNFSEINLTTVFPSPRISERVPFGTGRAMQQWINNKQKELLTYNFTSFLDLKVFFDKSEQFFTEDDVELPESIQLFLHEINFNENLIKIRANSTNKNHFKSLLFKWFNAFKTLKYLHFSRADFYENESILIASNKLATKIGVAPKNEAKSMLIAFRNIQQSRKMSHE